MFTERRPGIAVVILLILVSSGHAFGQGDIIVDGSGSMAGFAQASGARMRGIVERLHGAISLAGPQATRLVLISQSSNGTNRWAEQPLKAFGAAVANPSSYRDDTPLQWALEQERQKSDEFIIITDGMETGARLGGFISVLKDLAASGWGIGVIATAMPFKGNYYTEMEMVIRDDLPKIAETVHGANTHWQVSKATCVGGTRENCYYFDGDRPLLFIVLSKSGDLETLFTAVTSSLKDNQLDSTHVVQLSPFRSIKTVTRVRAIEEQGRRFLVLPDLSKGETQFRCLANNKPLSVEIVVQGDTAISPPQPSEIRIINVQVLTWPTWAKRRKDPLFSGAQTVLPVEITCDSSIFDRLIPSGPYILQKGSLEVRFEQTWSNAKTGWWLDWNASNSWQFPHKVYKLAEMVEAVHQVSMTTSLRLKPTTTRLILTAAGPK